MNKTTTIEFDIPCGKLRVCFMPKFKRVNLNFRTNENCIHAKLSGLGKAATLLWQHGQIQAFGKALWGTCCTDQTDRGNFASSCEDALAIAINEYFPKENNA